MAIKIQGSTIIDDGRQIVGVSTIFVDNVDPTTIGLTTTFSVNAEESSVVGVTFSDDGTRMFIIGNGGDNVSQYSLSTAWDLDTASYVSGEDYDDRADGEPRGVTWSSDGKYFYTHDREDIFQHESVTPFSLTNAYYTEKTYTYSAETGSAGAEVKFKIDGTKMYVSENSTDRIYQYSLATPWDVSTASYDSVFADFNSDETVLNGFAFNPSGTKLIICGSTGNKLIYYTLSTPWDLSTLSSGTDIATGLNNPYGIYWRNDGGKLYVANANSDNIVEYTITQSNEGVHSFISGGVQFYGDNEFYGNQTFIKDVSTRGDLSVEGTLTIGDNNPGANLSINGVSDLSTILRTNNIENSYKENNKTFSFEFYDNIPRGVGFKTDGTRMYMSGQEGNDITEFELSTPWEAGTASPTGVTYFLGYDPGSIKFKSDGSKLFVTNPAADDIREYDVPTPWDLTSITGLSTSFVFSQGSPDEVSGLDFTPDGSRMFVMDRILDNVHEYSLSTPWSVDTAVGPGSSFYVGTQNSDPFGIAIDPSGVHMYIVGISQNFIHQYEMSTAFDVQTATYTSKSLATVETDTTGVFIKPDGSQIFITGYASDLIRTFDLSTPFDVSTGVASSTFSVGDEEPYGLWFKSDGTELYVSKETGDKIDQYTLSTAWNVATAGFTTTFFTGDENDLPAEVQLSPSGDKLFVADYYTRSIVQYPLSVAWDISSASTGIRTAYELGEEGTRRLAGFAIDNGGTRLYALDNTTTNRIIQYEMSTAFDVSTISYNGDSLYLRGNGGLGYPWETESRGLTFNKYGTKLFTSGYTYDQILQFNLRVPYDLSTASFEKSIYSRTQGPSSLEIDPFNSRLYVVDSTGDKIVQFDTKGNGGNDLDLDSIEFKDDSFYLDDSDIKPNAIVGEGNMYSVFFSPDGRNMYTTGHEYEGIYHYRLSTPWDVRTSKIQGLHHFYGLVNTVEQNKSIATTNPFQLYFREDGKFLAVLGETADTIYSFELETAWELSSITRVLGEFYIGTEDDSPECLWFSNDGVYMYSGGGSSNSIFQYTLSTPWDITTASLTRSYNVNSFDQNLVGISFSGDGRKLYFIGYTNVASPKIHEHTLETPWDISSASTTKSFGINSISGTYLRGLYVRPDMSEFFVLDYLADYVHRYKIPTETVEFTSTIEAYGDIDVYQDVNVSGRLNAQGAYIENYLGIGTDGYRSDVTLVSEGPALIPSIGNRPLIENLELLDEDFFYPVRPYILQAGSMHLSADGKNLYLGTRYSSNNAETGIVQYKLKTPFKINTAEYYGHYNFITQESSFVYGLSFSSDGTKVFASIEFSSSSSSQIVERTLDVAWDITSISSNTGPTLITAGFGNEDEIAANIRGLEFNADGTKLYYIKAGGSSSNAFGYIYEHTLSSAYDLSTVSAEPSFTYGDDRVTQTDIFGFVNSTSFDLQFNADGTKLFINRSDGNGNTPFMYRYNLTTPYDLSTLAYEGVSYRNYHVVTIYGFHITSDGKKLYAVSNPSYMVYEFDLETPWDLNSYKYPQNRSGILFPPGGTDDAAYFCDHGKKFYSYSGNTGDISVYNLKNPYDITNLTESSDGWESINLNTASEFANFYQFRVTEDGMNGYAAVFSNNSSGTAQFKFQTPFDFTSLYPVVNYKGHRNLSQDVGDTIMDSIVSPDGKKLYELNHAIDVIYEHDIKVPFDLRTARRTEGKLWVGGNSEPRGIGFGTDGKTLYWVAGNTGQIQEAKTSDDEDLYDIRTMSWSGITTTTVNTTGTQDFAFNNDGSKLYTLEITSDSIHERTLTYNGNIRVSSGATSYSFASDGITDPQGMQFKSDGSSLFVVDNGTNSVYQYALTTPFAVDTISGLTTSFIVSNESIQPYSLRFKPDGTKMFVLNYTGNNTGDEYKIYSYNLSSPWNLDTASYTGDSFKVRYKTFTPEGIEFSPDGKRLLVSSTYFDSIYQFELSIPWDITTATYETTSLDVGSLGSVIKHNASRQMEMSPDGRTLIVGSQGNATGTSILFQYQLKTPWRINTASYVSQYTFNSYAQDNRYFTIGNAHFDWDNGDVYFMYRANSTTNGQVVRAKLPEYKDDKIEVFGGLDVYGKTRFEGSIDVKEPSKFEYIGIGTDNQSLRSQLTVSGNANLPSISPNEMDIENYYIKSKDYFSVSTPDDRSNNTTADKSDPYGLSFSPDGRYMYLTAGNNTQNEESIYQYELGILWDISTAKFEHGLWVASTEVSSYAANELNPRDVGFGSDGKYMYMVGESSDTVFQWTLGTPYQINTAGLTTSFNVSSEESGPQWVGFSTGGDRMYIVGDSDEINEYSLSTPWFVDSASFDSNTALDGASNETAAYIKSDGTKIWIIDQSNEIHEYNFGTPWDSSTLTISTEDSERYTGDANSLPFKELTLQKYGILAAEGLYFSPDGFNMYVADTTIEGVFRFHMDTPWDFENAKPKELPYGYLFDDVTQNYLQNGTTEVGTPEGLYFSPDGTKVYTMAPDTQRVYEFVLDTPWEVNTIRYEGKYYELHSHGGNVTTDGTNGLTFKPDGTKMFVVSGSGFYQYLNGYDLKTPWDILTATPADRFDLYTESFTGQDVEFNNDGTKFYISSESFGVISEFECTVPWDLTTARSVADKFTLIERNGLPNQGTDYSITRGFEFKPDGSRLYVYGSGQDKLFQVDLEEYWQVKTGQQKYEISLGYDLYSVRFKPDGLKVYLTDYANSLVKEHDLTTAWDITTLNTTPTSTFSTAGQAIQPLGIEFKPDGTKMWIAPFDTGNDNIYEYDLSPAWDITSATASHQFDPPGETRPSQIQFSDDGRKFYVMGDDLHVVQQFDVDVPWDLSSIRPYVSSAYPETTNFQSYKNGNLSTDNNPFFYVKRDGSLLFMSSQQQQQYTPLFNSIVQYTLNDLYDVRTARLENRGHVILYGGAANAISNIRGMSFNGDGSRLYVTDSSPNHRIWELELAIPFKIDTATISGRFIDTDNSTKPGQPGVTPPFHESNVYGIYVKKDGTRLYFTGITSDIVWQVELPSKPLDLSGNVRVHGELNADYTVHTPELKASYIDADRHVSIGSSDRSYGPNETALTVHGKSDISKIHRESDFRNFTINTQWMYAGSANATPTDIYFKPGGTTLYVQGSAGEDIDEWVLDAPYDLRNAKWVRNVSLNEFGLVDSRGLQFKPDGTKLFATDVNADDVYEFSLSTPWDITTVGLTTVYEVSEDNSISGLHIGAGGTTMYLTGYNPNDDVFQYSISTAWDLTSTVAFTTSKSLNEDGITQPEGIYVVPDGTRLFVTDVAGEEIAQYEMSTPFDVSTAGLTTIFHSGYMNPYGIEFINNGMEYVMISNALIGIVKYSCEEPYNINTTNGPLCSGRLLVQSAENGGLGAPYSVNLKPDGTKLYVGEYSGANPNLYEYDLRIPWDVGSAKLNQSLALPTTKLFTEWRFKPDGTKMYGLDYDNSVNSAIEEYELTKPWDISTAGLTTTFVIGDYETQPLSLNILPDGSRFYISGTQRDAFFGWEMTRPWDLRSVRRIAKDFYVGNQDVSAADIAWGDSGRKLYILGAAGDDVIQYTLTNGGYGYEYDLRYVDESTATSFSVATQDNVPEGFHFKSDGTQMWMVGNQNDKIYKYTLSTAWDISTASISQTMSGTTQATPYDIELSDDGEYVYVYGSELQIHQYRLSTPYDLNTISDVITESYYMPGAIVGAADLAFEFGRDGTRLYVTGSGGQEENGLYRVHQFNLSEAWNIRTANYVNSFRLYWFTHTQPTTPKGIVFRPDGKQFTVVCDTSEYAVSYDLETPWELNSAHYDGDWRSYDTNNDAASSPENVPFASTFNSDGTEFYIIGDSHYIHKWDLRVPYDFTTASTSPSDFYLDNFSRFAFNTLYGLSAIYGMYLAPDDEKLYITTVISGADAVWEFKIPRGKTELLGKTEIKSLNAYGANIDALQANSLTSNNIGIEGDLVVGDASADYETTIQFETPTGNRVVTIPDKSGFVGIVPGGSYQIMYNEGSRLSAGSSFTYNPNYGSVVLTGGNITTTTPYQVLNLSQTWNNASGIYTGIQLNITDTNSSASSKLVDLQVDTTTVVDVFKDGAVTLNAGYIVSGLPAGTVGQIARVTDANAPTIGAAVVGSGTSNALCWYNGSNWSVIGV
jgi:DNA-binding beta-propeller fold protein YncE